MQQKAFLKKRALKLNRIKALIFDYNGTIVDDVAIHLKAYQQALGEVGIRISKREMADNLGQSTYENIKAIIERHGAKADYKVVTERKMQLYVDAVKGRNILFSGVLEFLKQLKARGFKLGLYTGSPRKQITTPGLYKLFDVVVAGRTRFPPRPNPQGLLHLAKRMGANQKECAYIGDMSSDMQTARNAEMLAIGIENEFFPSEVLLNSGADIVISNFNELEKVID